jgi:hypothetical protein
MISYHHDSSFDMCDRICTRLRVNMNEFFCINLSDHVIDRSDTTKYGWTEIICTVVYIKEWLKQSKIPTLFFSA